MRLILTSLLAATVAVSTLTAQAPRIPADCNRACLEGLINQYLDAVVAHDPRRLPLAADVRYTENEQLLAGARQMVRETSGENDVPSTPDAPRS